METTPEGIYKWTHEAIIEFLVKNPSITCLDLSWRDFRNKEHELEEIFQVVSKYPLQIVDLSSCRIGNKGMKLLASCIQNMSTLTRLRLGNNCFDKAGAKEITNLIAAGKFSLVDITWCDEIETSTDIGTQELLEAILQSPSRTTLRDLNLRSYYAKIKRDDAVTLAAAKLVSECSSLKTFTYDWGPQTKHTTLVAFFQALKFNKTIQIFGIYNNDVATNLLDDCFHENSTIIKTDGNIPSRYALINRLCKELKAGEAVRKSVPKQLTEVEDISNFLRDLTAAKASEWNRPEIWNSVKLVVLGHGEIGKTTLLGALKNIKSLKRFFKKASKSGSLPRTIGVDLSQMGIGKGDVTIFDFGGQLEYTVTHQFFLSLERVVYVVCFDLSAPLEKQMEQISYWLNFLNSSLPADSLPNTNAHPKWKVLIAGLREDKCVDSSLSEDIIRSWESKYSNLPLHSHLFRVSSFTSKGVKELLVSIEEVCNQIFAHHTTLVPAGYKRLLKSLQSIDEQNCILTVAQLAETHADGIDEAQFRLALQYLHSIGRVILLKGGLICTNPQVIPKLAAKFISPKDVRMKLIDCVDVEILEEESVAVVLGQKTQKLRLELDVLKEVGVCFQLCGKKLERPVYLFPSLTCYADKIMFPPHTVKVACDESCFKGIKINSRNQLIFVPGFFCQLIVSLFEKLNISRREIVEIHSNGVVLSCSGLFLGELIVKIEPDSRSILFLMFSAHPDLSFAVNVFKSLVDRQFAQYAGCDMQVLCPVCIDSAFRLSTMSCSEISVVDPNECENDFQVCLTKHHKFSNVAKPPSKPDAVSCRTHKKTHHDYFVNYRVATEGKKAPSYSSENSGGFVELFYERLATRKRVNGESVSVFWDRKCLNIGQDWEHGFMYGLTHSKVIVLLLSNKVMEGIAANATKQQDNVLIEYECALIQNALYGTPVFPVFVAELQEDGSFTPFDHAKAKASLTDVPHVRGEDAQTFIDELSQGMADKKKRCLTTISKTVQKLFKLQGHFLVKRGEDKTDLDKVIDMAMEALETQCK